MIWNAMNHAFILPFATAALVFGLASDLEAAPSAPRSMSELMHLNHASDLRAMPAMGTNTLTPKDFRSSSPEAGTAAGCESSTGESGLVSDPEPARAAPRSMSEVMHLDHAPDLPIQAAGTGIKQPAA